MMMRRRRMMMMQTSTSLTFMTDRGCFRVASQCCGDVLLLRLHDAHIHVERLMDRQYIHWPWISDNRRFHAVDSCKSAGISREPWRSSTVNRRCSINGCTRSSALCRHPSAATMLLSGGRTPRDAHSSPIPASYCSVVGKRTFMRVLHSFTA
ncbi:uncharacterized protein K489DRAFT_158000 [Dissoconium aciculare CBS 342.82]|uniref:Uncharacterized protein n=1 Tax=Dissoconium aciculare CBS 342.82 TaxID=1314786 RepID=A0A6J3MBR0_9PEZI|nr:uncharacterized protein K489DRAFT_158000 [Dissoconium aciculare CBS 342.82]KAF1825456.1 hypothetical protein K489DRAFT_158000 [Dissoconium aciculare CBS 342.82]